MAKLVDADCHETRERSREGGQNQTKSSPITGKKTI
jgi:hypothetical protein